MTEDDRDNWWKDLLSFWRPSGVASGDHGLRLAVRNGYLNFYRRGQSIARVSQARDGFPVAAVHQKYVQPGATGQTYARLRGNEVRLRGDPTALVYSGRETLQSWITASKKWAGDEKIGVDLAVGCNPGVVDLEMGLPAHAGSASALRMDLVALERADSVVKIVFWEAKNFDDSRLRARETPEILRQIKGYLEFMNDKDRRHRIIEAYRSACDISCKLHALARQIGPIEDLAPIVREAAEPASRLEVDPTPRLVIFDIAGSAPKNWPQHEAKLREAGVRLFVRRATACRFSEFEGGT